MGCRDNVLLRESITERQNEFEAACASFARCVKPGGALIAAFLVRSSGYEVAGRKFPVLELSAEIDREHVHCAGS